MKRIVTIQDISCVGKCSLTVALPIISAMGIETSIIPTAVLSTHTVFSDFTFKDLTDQIVPITNHWKKEHFSFDAIYTGYLGSFEQIDLMKNFFDEFKTDDNILFADPAMADNGRLYPSFDNAFAKHMATLCAKADIIVPNITEAALMTDTVYKEVYDETYIRDMLKALTCADTKICIITGVSFNEHETGVMGYDRTKDEFYYYAHHRHPQIFHGTGDIFSSTCIGAIMNGQSWQEAATIAADYTAQCIQATVNDPDANTYGVNFETALPYLIKRLERNN